MAIEALYITAGICVFVYAWSLLDWPHYRPMPLWRWFSSVSGLIAALWLVIWRVLELFA